MRITSTRGSTPLLCSKMCSRPCLRKPTRYENGGTDLPVPPTVSYYLQLLPMESVPFLSDSKSRGRKAVRVRPPPPAPGDTQGPRDFLGPFHWSLVLMEGVERARGADEEEEKRDFRSASARRPAGRAKA